MPAALALRQTYPARSGAFMDSWREAEPRFFAFGMLLAMSIAPTLFARSVDQRTFLGIDVWQKPLKFQFALVVYLLTLAFFARYIAPETRARRWYRVYSGAVVAAIMTEIAWIGGAAMLGTGSHFNQAGAGAVLYPVMGVVAVFLTSATMVYAVLIARNPDTGLPPVLREAVVLGLALVLPLTLVTAGTMSQMGSHLVGGSGSDAGGLALMGWARDGGDLRVAHFFATHSMHIVPLFGLVALTLFEPRNRAPVRLFAAGFTLFVAFTFAQALSGRPFIGFLQPA
jgi:hypothetical protein